MDYFSRKPDFPTFEDIYIARAQGAIELERRGDEAACRFGPDGPAFMLSRGASRGNIIRGCLACDGIVEVLKGCLLYTSKDEGHLRASRSEGLQPCRDGRRGQEGGRDEAIG